MATDFGYDTSCVDSLRTGRFVSGVRLVAEAAYRRLITTRGMLQGGDDEANYGFDLADAIGSANTAATAAALPGQVESELMKDERIDSVTVTIVQTQVGPAWAFNVTIEAQTALGPFSLVLSVTEVTTQILGIAASS